MPNGKVLPWGRGGSAKNKVDDNVWMEAGQRKKEKRIDL